MTVLGFSRRRWTSLATLAAACSFGVHATAQVTPAPQYGGPAAAYSTPAPTAGYTQHPMYAAPTTPPAYAQTTPAAQVATPTVYGQPAVAPAATTASAPSQPAYAASPYGQPAYQQPVYAAPRVAQAGSLPSPAETITPAPPAVPATPTMPAAPATVMTGHTVDHAVTSHAAPATTSWESYAGTTAAGCATGDCGTSSYGACGATACDIGVGLPPRPRRQWFGGLYYLLLDRVDNGDCKQVGYMTDTDVFDGRGSDYYYQPSDAGLFIHEADFDPLHGAEIRFGSTFGPTDPCTCSQRFAWELAYWALDDQSADAWLLLDSPVSSANPMRIYGTLDKRGLRYDLDGSGATADRPADEYYDNGVPADDDLSANNVRILAFRVRRRFSAQNLELNFWRFGSPECQACTAGPCGGGAGCGDSCYGAGACGVAACKPARMPRRFFINGQFGVRYFRADDDLGLDTQFTLVDGAGDPQAGWGASYTGFPADEVGVLIEDYEVDNELVGLQLGCSMNYLVGCKWNLFADTNFGIYGNDAEVYQRIIVGGGGTAAYAESGAEFSSLRYSDTNVAFLGELRTGVAYQLTCNCRLSAAYRFIGAGGLALAHSQIPDNYANEGVISKVDAEDSLLLHGLQLGAEFKY